MSSNYAAGQDLFSYPSNNGFTHTHLTHFLQTNHERRPDVSKFVQVTFVH